MGRLLLALPLLAWWAWASQQAVQVWRSELTLWAHAVGAGPGTVRAQRNLEQVRLMRR